MMRDTPVGLRDKSRGQMPPAGYNISRHRAYCSRCYQVRKRLMQQRDDAYIIEATPLRRRKSLRVIARLPWLPHHYAHGAIITTAH